MNHLQNNSYLRGYMNAFSLYPVGEKDDPWDDVRLAFQEVGDALWGAMLDYTPILEQRTRGTAKEQAARKLGATVRKEYERLGA